MRYKALAADYDGTLARHGRVAPATVEALERLRRSGRRLILVTGRELEELLGIFFSVDLFDRVVAENGALLYRPQSGEVSLLGARPPLAFVEKLRRRCVKPMSVGRVIVATWEPEQEVALETIRDLGLELQIIVNKRAVMILPSGIDKATGLAAALEELGLSPSSVIGIGDAENDQGFLELCGRSVAVANALPMLKERVDWITVGDHGDGVVELIEQLLDDDLRDLNTIQT
jgi:hydroxymethylpyrimidine pyrophosphatase-like HAD family hydrolase